MKLRRKRKTGSCFSSLSCCVAAGIKLPAGGGGGGVYIFQWPPFYILFYFLAFGFFLRSVPYHYRTMDKMTESFFKK
jgi:hypothetical protein